MISRGCLRLKSTETRNKETSVECSLRVSINPVFLFICPMSVRTGYRDFSAVLRTVSIKCGEFHSRRNCVPVNRMKPAIHGCPFGQHRSLDDPAASKPQSGEHRSRVPNLRPVLEALLDMAHLLLGHRVGNTLQPRLLESVGLRSRCSFLKKGEAGSRVLVHQPGPGADLGRLLVDLAHGSDLLVTLP